MALVINRILKDKRQFFVDKVKKPLMKGIIDFYKWNNPVVLFWLIVEIIRLCRRYPEPTEGNLVFHNSRIALRVFGKIDKYHNNPGRRALVNTFGRMVIDTLEHDGYYEFLHDFYLIEMLREGWQPEHRGFPMYRHWTGPLYTDNWSETNADWLFKRRKELIEQADANLARVQAKIDDDKLWYFNLSKFPKLIEKRESAGSVKT